jgi:hypothetical protein
MVCPTAESFSIFSIVGAMGTHNPNFIKTEKPDNDGNPNCQWPGSDCPYAGPPDKKPWKTDKEEVNQFFWPKMAVDATFYRTFRAV